MPVGGRNVRKGVDRVAGAWVHHRPVAAGGVGEQGEQCGAEELHGGCRKIQPQTIFALTTSAPICHYLWAGSYPLHDCIHFGCADCVASNAPSMRAAMRQIRLLTPSRAALAARCALSTTAAGTSVPPPSTSATARPTTTADAVVIGSGVIGTAVALGLARRGYTVRCVERMREAGLGTTSYSSGIIRTCYTALDSCKFAWEGTHYWSDWEAFVGGGGSTDDGRGFARYRECGGMIPLTESSEAFVDNCLRHYDTLGIPYVEEKKRDERGQRLTMCEPILCGVCCVRVLCVAYTYEHKWYT